MKHSLKKFIAGLGMLTGGSGCQPDIIPTTDGLSDKMTSHGNTSSTIMHTLDRKKTTPQEIIQELITGTHCWITSYDDQIALSYLEPSTIVQTLQSDKNIAYFDRFVQLCLIMEQAPTDAEKFDACTQATKQAYIQKDLEGLLYMMGHGFNPIHRLNACAYYAIIQYTQTHDLQPMPEIDTNILPRSSLTSQSLASALAQDDYLLALRIESQMSVSQRISIAPLLINYVLMHGNKLTESLLRHLLLTYIGEEQLLKLYLTAYLQYTDLSLLEFPYVSPSRD